MSWQTPRDARRAEYGRKDTREKRFKDRKTTANNADVELNACDNVDNGGLV
jgi:hypothetical protein